MVCVEGQARRHSGPVPNGVPANAGSELEWLTREAIHQVNVAARDLARNPTSPRARSSFQEAMDNLTLARQALDEEVRLGNLSRDARSALLNDMAGIVEIPDAPSSPHEAPKEEAEVEAEGEDFVPNAIPDSDSKKIKVKVRVSEPSGGQVFYIRSGVLGIGPSAYSGAAPGVPAKSGTGEPAAKSQPFLPGVRRVEVGYNPPLGLSSSSGSGGGGSTASTKKSDKSVNLLTPVLASALERFKKKTAESKGGKGGTGAASGKGIEVYQRGLSGASQEAQTSGPTGYIPQFYDMIVRARSLASPLPGSEWQDGEGGWGSLFVQSAKFVFLVALVYALLWSGGQLAPLLVQGKRLSVPALGTRPDERDARREAAGQKKLEPRQLYVRIEPGTNRWVLVRTDGNGDIRETVGQVCAGTVVSGSLLPSSDCLRRYKLDTSGNWLPTEESEQFVLWARDGGARRS